MLVILLVPLGFGFIGAEMWSSNRTTPRSSPSSIGPKGLVPAADDILDALGDGISHCLYCLYGLDLGLGTRRWGGGHLTAPKDRSVE